MSTLYWISVLGALSNLASTLAIITGIIVISVAIACIITKCDDNEDGFKACRKWGLAMFCVLLFNALVTVFVPSKDELYVIYGVGGTIDYLKNNPTATQLPDKTIKMLDLMVDEFIDKHTNDSDTTKTN